MELTIVDIETIIAKTEQRQDVVTEQPNLVRKSRPQVQQQQDTESQLPLF